VGKSLAIFYQKLLAADLLPCVGVLLFLAVYPRLRAAAGERQPRSSPRHLPRRWWPRVAFAVLPFFGLLLAKLYTGAFAER